MSSSSTLSVRSVPQEDSVHRAVARRGQPLPRWTSKARGQCRVAQHSLHPTDDGLTMAVGGGVGVRKWCCQLPDWVRRCTASRWRRWPRLTTGRSWPTHAAPGRPVATVAAGAVPAGWRTARHATLSVQARGRKRGCKEQQVYIGGDGWSEVGAAATAAPPVCLPPLSTSASRRRANAAAQCSHPAHCHVARSDPRGRVPTPVNGPVTAINPRSSAPQATHASSRPRPFHRPPPPSLFHLFSDRLAI